MSFTPRSAKNAKVRIGSTVLTAKSWTVDAKADKLDVSNAEGGGFYQFIGGLLQADVTIDFDLDGANNNYDIANIQPGNNNVAGVKLYLNDVNAAFWNFPNFFIERMPNTGNVKEAVKGQLIGAGSGTFSFPTGVF